MNSANAMTDDQPYPGLRSFRRDETHIFFGREATTYEMVRRLAVHHFLAVTGTSGSGKSSMVRTGLLDALDRGLLAEAGADWRVADFRPGRRPLAALAHALLEAIGADASDQENLRTEAVLARGPLGLLEWLRGANLSLQTNLLVLADQFEEIFRFHQGQARDDIDAFVALLLASAQQREKPIYVVITMRSDFLGDCSQFTGLAEAINDGQFLTPRLTRVQCQQAIEGPAAVFGGKVESALVTRLLNDMGTNADQLPLVQHMLMRLWGIAAARAGGAAPELKLADYEKLGGFGDAQAWQSASSTEVAGESKQLNALSAHADEILSELTESQQHLATSLFRALTESQGAAGRDIRRPITLGEAAEICGVPLGDLVPVVEAFRAPGCNLLTPAVDVALGAETIIDISHESLIRQWGTLRKWVREEFLAAETYRHVETTAKLWQRGEAALLTMPYLGLARAWRERERPNRAWAARYGDGFDLAMKFLDESEEAERRAIEAEENARRRSARRTRAVAVAMGVLALIAGGFAYFGFEAAVQAQRNADAARKSALDAETARSVAVDMSRRVPQERDRAQVRQSTYLAELSRQRFAEGNLVRSLLLAMEALPDERNKVQRPEVREAKEMLVQGYHQIAAQFSPMKHTTKVSFLRFVPPDNRLLSASHDGTLRLWNRNGRLLQVLGANIGPITGADVTPDGKLIATTSYEGIVQLWNTDTAKILSQFTAGNGNTRAVSISRDGTAVLTAGPDQVARVWNAQSGRMITELRGHTDDVLSAEFRGDGLQAVTVSADHTAGLWDVKSGKLLKRIEFSGTEYVIRAMYTPNGEHVVSSAMNVRWGFGIQIA